MNGRRWLKGPLSDTMWFCCSFNEKLLSWFKWHTVVYLKMWKFIRLIMCMSYNINDNGSKKDECKHLEVAQTQRKIWFDDCVILMYCLEQGSEVNFNDGSNDRWRNKWGKWTTVRNSCSVISNEKRMTFESQTPLGGKTSFMMLCWITDREGKNRDVVVHFSRLIFRFENLIYQSIMCILLW